MIEEIKKFYTDLADKYYKLYLEHKRPWYLEVADRYVYIVNCLEEFRREQNERTI